MGPPRGMEGGDFNRGGDGPPSSPKYRGGGGGGGFRGRGMSRGGGRGFVPRGERLNIATYVGHYDLSIHDSTIRIVDPLLLGS